MSDQQLRDEVMTLVLAGHETTANALSWTLYLLSTHPKSSVASSPSSITCCRAARRRSKTCRA